ncbi:MAG: hypothetical protein ACR2HY_03250 [Acidimicrobiales bacterium]
MLYVLGFERIAVVVGDLYFVNPRPEPGQEGAERGARLEVRLLERDELPGSIYSAQPIAIGRPLWRADLLESVAGPPASFDRAHHHPAFTGWEPGRRHFDKALSADPVAWVGARLSDLGGMLAQAGVSEVDASDVSAAVPEILEVLRRLLERVWAGELAQTPTGGGVTSARVGWL